jgi:hypothetical protein
VQTFEGTKKIGFCFQHLNNGFVLPVGGRTFRKSTATSRELFLWLHVPIWFANKVFWNADLLKNKVRFQTSLSCTNLRYLEKCFSNQLFKMIPLNSLIVSMELRLYTTKSFNLCFNDFHYLEPYWCTDCSPFYSMLPANFKACSFINPARRRNFF